jgi:hypothetical protein
MLTQRKAAAAAPADVSSSNPLRAAPSSRAAGADGAPAAAAGSSNPLRAAQSFRAAGDDGAPAGDATLRARNALSAVDTLSFAPRAAGSARSLAFKPLAPSVIAPAAARGVGTPWVECQSRSQGRPYWRHQKTGEIMWDPPPGC